MSDLLIAIAIIIVLVIAAIAIYFIIKKLPPDEESISIIQTKAKINADDAAWVIEVCNMEDGSVLQTGYVMDLKQGQTFKVGKNNDELDFNIHTRAKISEHHLNIYVSNNEYYVENVSSKGTYYAGKAFDKMKIQSGKIILLANVLPLRFIENKKQDGCKEKDYDKENVNKQPPIIKDTKVVDKPFVRKTF